MYKFIKESTAEVKEGTTYQPAVDLHPSISTASMVNTREIPDAALPLIPKSVDNGQNSFLYFDLETTGLGR